MGSNPTTSIDARIFTTRWYIIYKRRGAYRRDYMFYSNPASPAHCTSSLIRSSFPRLVARGMKMRKVSNHELLLEDIDEWLWSDQQTIQNASQYELCFDIYACSSNGVDTLRGLVVGVSITPPLRMLRWWKLLLALAACMVIIFWCQAIHFSNVVYIEGVFENDSSHEPPITPPTTPLEF